MEHQTEDLIQLFNRLFADKYNTRLIRGADEPVYLPADEIMPYHRLVFAHDFFSSALHEIAHWCAAGVERRQLVDFGYWYKPDGRSGDEQKKFERVEVKPQALEWIFSAACGHSFHFSAGNLNDESGVSVAFKDAVHQQVLAYCRSGLESRAEEFRLALCDLYGRQSNLHEDRFCALS